MAVIVTLALLILEIRTNTNATQAQTYQDLMNELNDYRRIFTDPAFIPLYTAAEEKLDNVGLAALTEAEWMTLWAPSTTRWGIYESAYFANERGVLGPAEWSRFETAVCRGYEEEAHFWRPEGRAALTDLLIPEFVAYVEGRCR